MHMSRSGRVGMALLACGFLPVAGGDLAAQGVTTAAISGIVTTDDGVPLATANVIAIHQPSGTQYRAVARAGGAYNLPNLRIGGPYRVSVQLIGYQAAARDTVFLSLGQDLRLDFRLSRAAVQLQAVEVRATAGDSVRADPGQARVRRS